MFLNSSNFKFNHVHVPVVHVVQENQLHYMGFMNTVITIYEY